MAGTQLAPRQLTCLASSLCLPSCSALLGQRERLQRWLSKQTSPCICRPSVIKVNIPEQPNLRESAALFTNEETETQEGKWLTQGQAAIRTQPFPAPALCFFHPITVTLLKPLSPLRVVYKSHTASAASMLSGKGGYRERPSAVFCICF